MAGLVHLDPHGLHKQAHDYHSSLHQCSLTHYAWYNGEYINCFFLRSGHRTLGDWRGGGHGEMVALYECLL